MMNNMIMGLGLESSCDETAASIVVNGKSILSNQIYSQLDIHRPFSGVVPEVASRAHLEKINLLIADALHEAGADFDDISYVSVANRPGLIGSLMISVQTAKTISYVKKIPFITVSHLEAHLYAPFLEGADISFPFIGLLVSGGNTALYLVRDFGNIQILGRTTDDAVGEAYDKISKFLKLGYPGGPVIDKLANSAVNKNVIFPKLLRKNTSYNFSYSGLKTAVINYIKNNPDASVADVVYGFQESALEILIRNVFASARELSINTIVVAGGVASNSRLRELLFNEKNDNETILLPSPILSTDNAAMTAGLGYQYFIRQKYDSLNSDVFSRDFITA